LVWWTLAGNLTTAWLAIYLTVLVGSFATRVVPGIAAGAGAALLLFVVGKLQKLETWLAHPVLQYFGRISYSLYLIHYIVGMPLTRFLSEERSSAQLGSGYTCGVMLAALALSIGVSHLVHIWVEKPTVAWSRRLSPGAPRASSRPLPVLPKLDSHAVLAPNLADVA
jgi:peptidoglycan/LPS O-acetylase OafA/YrhL